MSEQNLDKNTNLDNIVWALLFAADEPLSLRRLSAILEDVPTDDIREVLDSWRTRFDEESWSIAVEQVAGGYQVVTRSDYAPFVGRLYSKRRKLRLSRAGLETLAIIAYRQPVTRAEVENVRGVGSGSVIANLMERSLVKITGKAKVLGAPFLYGTTPEFLEYLGLNSLKDLPSLAELEAMLEKEAYPENALDVDGSPAATDEPEPAPAETQEERAQELFETTAAEVAAAMAAVQDARAAIPQPAKAEKPADAEGPPKPADATEAAGPPEPEPAESTDAPAQSAGGGAARLGPAIDEPHNRPLDPSTEPDDDTDTAEEPAAPSALDERDDGR